MLVVHPTNRRRVWSEEEYLHWPEMRLIEFNNGHVEELPTPTVRHQVVLGNLMLAIDKYVSDHHLGIVLHSPFPIQTGSHRFREPDVIFRKASAPQSDPATTYYWDQVSFVAEVLADDPEERHRDLVDKRLEYAESGIPEYWLIDPASKQVNVLQLQGKNYFESGPFEIPESVRSSVITGLEIPVAEIFAD